MAVKLSGLSSGLDTEAIIKEMMSAQSMKKTKIENKLTKLEWKEEKWKDLNKKIYGLYTGSLSKFRSQSSYLTKSVSASDTTKATFSASSSVPTGIHTVSIDKVASAQFITGNVTSYKGTITVKNDGGTESVQPADLALSNGTLLTNVAIKTNGGSDSFIAAGTKLTLNIGKFSGTDPDIKSTAEYMVTEKTTIADISSWCRQYHINFSYDSTNQRFFLSSQLSGEENAFTLTSSENYTKQYTVDGSNVDYNGILTYNVGYDYLDVSVLEEGSADKTAMTNIITNARTALGAYSEAYSADTIEANYAKFAKANQSAKLAVYKKYITDKFEEITDGRDDLELEWDGEDWTIKKTDRDSDVLISDYRRQLNDHKNAYDFDKLMNDPDDKTLRTYYNQQYVAAYDDAVTTNDMMKKSAVALTDGKKALEVLGVGEIQYDSVGGTGITSSSSARIIAASDMTCVYNGQEYVSSSNTLKINGLTINALEVTTSPIKVSVSNNTQAVYDMVKGFVKEYNEVLQEVNDLYYAKTAKGYDILTDEQRDKMTDEQIEKWENKIKDSLLRRDSTLEGIVSVLRDITSTKVEVGDKAYSIIDFGINTSVYTEKGLLHIYGDPDDASVSDQQDKLMAALSSDPEQVMEVLSKVGTELYTKLQGKMASTKLSSALTVYNDKEITSLKKEYEDEIEKWKKRLKEIEDRYYTKFAAMESAMTKLNSQTSYISSLFTSN